MTITRMQEPRQMYQEGGIMPRLNQLGSGVSSAEQMLQEINQRLESAESSLGSGGGGTLASAGPFMGQPSSLSADVATSAGISSGPHVNNLTATYDQRGPFNVQDAYAHAQKEAQKARAGGFLGQVVLPGEMTFEAFSSGFNPSNPSGQLGLSPLQQAMGFADGGRIGYARGDTAEQNAMQASGIMGLPLNENPAGVTELDLRETGGFIPPVGVKEKADDIPAMLSNNEFVFTADAVRAAGGGDIDKGAQLMYDTMKKLESKVV